MPQDIRRLRDVMQAAHWIGPNETVKAAGTMLTEGNVPAILVIEAGRVIGLLSNRDIVAKAISSSLAADETLVCQVMSSQPVRISDDRQVDHAQLVMRTRGVHEVLVQDFTGRVVGIYCDCGCCDTDREC